MKWEINGKYGKSMVNIWKYSMGIINTSLINTTVALLAKENVTPRLSKTAYLVMT